MSGTNASDKDLGKPTELPKAALGFILFGVTAGLTAGLKLIGVSFALSLLVVGGLLVAVVASYLLFKVEHEQVHQSEEKLTELAPEASFVRSQIELMRQVIERSKPKLKEYEEYTMHLTGGGIKSLVTAQRILMALEGRYIEVSTTFRENDYDSIILAKERLEQPLVVKRDSVHYINDGEPLPELDNTQWEPTIDTLICAIEREVESAPNLSPEKRVGNE